MELKEIRWQGVRWIDQDKDQWHVPVDSIHSKMRVRAEAQRLFHSRALLLIYYIVNLN
jgi:hypothetical protein